MGIAALVVSLLASTNRPTDDISRWSHRTAKRRQRTEHILHSIELGPPPPFFDILRETRSSTAVAVVGNISTLAAPRINWDDVNPVLDPIRGGKIRPDTPRGARKRAQVEAFTFAVSSILQGVRADKQVGDGNDRMKHAKKGMTIIDAGCGAGNLAIPLAGLLSNSGDDNSHDVEILAVDVNEMALHRLSERAAPPTLPARALRTICADLAAPDAVLDTISPDRDVIVVSLHACGAASDMAMNLAYRRDAPFVVCPCCTAKSLTKRSIRKDSDEASSSSSSNSDGCEPSASFQRSGATADINYPRSEWLRRNLTPSSTNNDANTYAHDTSISIEAKYTILSKVADVGLGPQTPTEQREQQRRAKQIVELDRLAFGSEQHGYDVRLVRIRDHDPTIYGKGELLLGAKKGSTAAKILNCL